ncbi:hypothetical protein FOCC_FOCC001399 [Frankliniella occidentalis]|nr:hypothetical protein FOCC_FOCC001399 [Frankliniella occidentalis]
MCFQSLGVLKKEGKNFESYFFFKLESNGSNRTRSVWSFDCEVKNRGKLLSNHSDKLMPNENNNTSLKNNNSSNNNHNAQIKTSMKNGHSNVSAHCQGSNLTSNNNSKTSNGTNGTCNSSSSSCSSSTSSTSSGNSKRFCNGGSAAGLGSILPEQRRLVDVTRDKPVKVTVRVVVPTRDHPKEEELRLSGDPKFCHLQLELHVEVTALAPPAEAHARIALALAEVRRFLVPVGSTVSTLSPREGDYAQGGVP